MRTTVARAAVALGLVFALGAIPNAPSYVHPVIAQDEESPDIDPETPTEAPGSPPSAPPGSGSSSPPPGSSPVFSPSGSGSGSSTGSGAGTTSSPAAPKPTGAGTAEAKPTAGLTPPLPPLGSVTYENPLKDETVFKAGRCFGNKAFTHYVGEGFAMRVMGPCHLLMDEAWITVPANGVTVGDGEVALEFKVVAGLPRAIVGLYVRNQNEQLIGVHVHPDRSEASLFTLNGGAQTDLAYQANLQPFLNKTDWNKVALRVHGHNAWLILNDEPVLFSNEVYADAGRVVVELVRSGTAAEDDEEESAVVLRNLTLTAIEGGEPGRAPKGP